MSDIPETLQRLVDRDREHDCEGYGTAKVCVKVVAVANFPTRFGRFHIAAFWNDRDEKDHIAIIRGDVVGREDVPTRLHSECLTGDALGSLRCDCRDQLGAALTKIGEHDHGLVLYLRQEGRGIGLKNKIRAYALQDRGLDTVEANIALGFRDDERDYSIAAHMIHSLGIKSIRLMTNNPNKIAQLTQFGINVSGRIPHLLPPNEFSRGYLETKALRSGHLIDIGELRRLEEQSDAPEFESVDKRE